MTFQQQGGCCSTQFESEKSFIETEKIYFEVSLKAIKGLGSMHTMKSYSSTILTVQRISTNRAGRKSAQMLKVGDGDEFSEHLNELKPIYNSLTTVAECKKFIKKYGGEE